VSESVLNAESVRLYGLTHAERMYLDVASLFESEIDIYTDPETGEDYAERYPEFVVEEWSVADPLSLITQADWFLENLEERLCEEHTHDNDDCHWIFTSPEVLAAAENLRQVIASKVTWHQADKHLADHKLTLVEGGPLFDGEPVYRPVQSDGSGSDTP
jgi:hypothetical protein